MTLNNNQQLFLVVTKLAAVILAHIVRAAAANKEKRSLVNIATISITRAQAPVLAMQLI